jgi:hypothetical protein
MTAKEWWIFRGGGIFTACPCQKGGRKFFKTATVQHLVETVNFGKDSLNVMSWQSIWEYVKHAFSDHNLIRLLVNGINNNHQCVLATAIKIVLDESSLPNLSFEDQSLGV